MVSQLTYHRKEILASLLSVHDLVRDLFDWGRTQDMALLMEQHYEKAHDSNV